MGYDYSKTLNPEKALIWRIVHRDNLPWILDNGLLCSNSSLRSDAWIDIGNKELIDKRATHPVPVGPKGVLSDYVPFYFTPFSVMMRNIRSGRGGVCQRQNDEIVILVSSLHLVNQLKLPFVFADSHAYYSWSNFYEDLADLDKIDWPLLQARDFKRDPDDPGKFERYQAEGLIHQRMPINALKGIFCYSDTLKLKIEGLLATRGIRMDVYVRKNWYFS